MIVFIKLNPCKNKSRETWRETSMAKVKVLEDRDNIFDSDDDSHDVDDSYSDNGSHSDVDESTHVVDGSHVDDDDSNVDDDKPTNDASDSDCDILNEENETSQTQDSEKSGMASVIARILSKDISKSNRVLLAKGKTSQEIFRDISERKRQREASENVNVKSKRPKEEKHHNMAKEEKRKIWESMGRKIPSILDNPKEVRLRKIATQGMVQLFRLVSQAKLQG